MDFSIKPIDVKTGVAGIKTGCIAVGVFEDRKLSQIARELRLGMHRDTPA